MKMNHERDSFGRPKMKNEEKSIHKLDLHEEKQLGRNGNKVVMRVPGGWIYIHRQDNSQHRTQKMLDSVFVPFNKEFSEK